MCGAAVSTERDAGASGRFVMRGAASTRPTMLIAAMATLVCPRNEAAEHSGHDEESHHNQRPVFRTAPIIHGHPARGGNGTRALMASAAPVAERPETRAPCGYRNRSE
jgi:hypothetical protein